MRRIYELGFTDAIDKAIDEIQESRSKSEAIYKLKELRTMASRLLILEQQESFQDVPQLIDPVQLK